MSIPAPVKYLDMTGAPGQVLDVMTLTYQRAELQPWVPPAPHVGVPTQINVTVVQHITVHQVTAPTPAPPTPTPQIEAPEQEPIPAYNLRPRRQARDAPLDAGDISALLVLPAVVTVLIGVLVFADALVYAVGVGLSAFAVAALVAFLASLGGGKCAGIIVHCGGCKG